MKIFWPLFIQINCIDFLLIQQMEPERKNERSITILSYNTLIQKSSYTPFVKSNYNWRSYWWNSRKQQLILKVVSQSPHVICLQQIRHINRWASPNYYDFYNPLYQMGFGGVFAKRNIDGEFGQEGLAIFFNRLMYSLVQSQVLFYQDGTGRHALGVTLRSNDGCIFTVVNTHIIYPSQIDQSRKQIQLLTEWPYLYQKNIPCFLAGDFNLCYDVTSHREILQKLQAKFYDSHKAFDCKKGTFSLNINGSNSPGMISQLLPTKIDYIFASNDTIITKAEVLGEISDLPTNNQPSDHLPICSTFTIQCKFNTVLEDVKKAKQIFSGVGEKNYNTSPHFKEFLDLFWLLPQSIKNAAYDLTYKKAVKLGIFEQNVQFGRIAFTNNTPHTEAILDEEGETKGIRWEGVSRDLIPNELIAEILQIIEERIEVIPELVVDLGRLPLGEFLERLDERIHIESCHKIYGEVYEIGKKRGRNISHPDYGRVCFRNWDGWSIQDEIKVEAMKRLILP